jgi:ABC-2 type transport system ATP-binding protein
VADPELFFLDEPTTGLDPQSRRQLWELIEEVKRAGRTVVITTHYMEEAERLCDRVAIVDHGKVIAFGTPRQLIASLGAQHIIEFNVGEDPPTSSPADQVLPGRSEGSPLTDAELLQLPGALSIRRREDSYLLESAQAHRTIPALLALLGARGLPLAQLRTHSATLEDVFVHLTGRTLRDG